MSDWLDTEETAEFLRCSKSTVYRLNKRKEITCTKRSIGLRFRKEDLESWLDKGRITNFQLTVPLPLDINKPKGGNGELAKKKPACLNYGFGRVYVRTYRSGRSSWTISYYNEDGKRVQKAVSQAQTKEEAALALQREFQKAHERKQGVEQKRSKIGFTAFSEVYLRDYAMVAKKSWKTDVGRLKIMREFFSDTEMREITPLMIQKFRSSRLKEGNAKSTCNRYLALLKRMFTIAIEESYAEENTVRKVKPFSEKDTLKERILAEEEEERLLEACADHLRPIVITALNTGMRRSEVLKFKWSQVDLNAREIRVEKTKGGKTRFIPINDDLLRMLYGQKRENGYVFLNPRTKKPYVDMKKGFKAACKTAEIEGMRFHDLRHTFASRLIGKGADIETVRDLLVHSSIVITQRYTHSTDERKRAAVELLSRGMSVTQIVTQGNLSKLIH